MVLSGRLRFLGPGRWLAQVLFPCDQVVGELVAHLPRGGVADGLRERLSRFAPRTFRAPGTAGSRLCCATMFVAVAVPGLSAIGGLVVGVACPQAAAPGCFALHPCQTSRGNRGVSLCFLPLFRLFTRHADSQVVQRNAQAYLEQRVLDNNG